MKGGSRISAADPVAADRAAGVLRAGGVIAFPTESSYGLGVDPFNASAVINLIALKGREASSPFPLVAGSIEQVEELFGALAGAALLLAGTFWPGPLTLALTAPPGLHVGVVSAHGGVGVRVPGLRIARVVPEGFGRPITATSANRSGLPPARSGDEIAASLGDDVDLILDGGLTPGGLPSTVLELTGVDPVLIREGAVPLAEIERVLGRRVRTAGGASL